MLDALYQYNDRPNTQRPFLSKAVEQDLCHRLGAIIDRLHIIPHTESKGHVNCC